MSKPPATGLAHSVQVRLKSVASRTGRPFAEVLELYAVVDCFRYRNKIGLDVAMEALRDAVRSRKAMISQIDRAAEVCRISSVMAPYLTALSA